jgi:hypothetical protein
MALWVRSYWRSDVWDCTYVGREWVHQPGAIRMRDIHIVIARSECGGLFFQWWGWAHAPVELVVASSGSALTSEPARRYPDIRMLGPTDMKMAETAEYRGFGFGRYDDPVDKPDDVYQRDRGVVFPHGVLVALFALLPGWKLAQLTRQAIARRRIGRGFCGKCGYDLRASRGRCPECGEAIAPGQPAWA